jgi:uncharacterized protein (TIGR03435 family)
MLILAAVASTAAFAQFEAARPSFAVASVKPSGADNGQSRFETNPSMLRLTNQTLRLTNQTLRGCIRAAYAGGGAPLKEYQVIGGPKWIDSVRYDIIAKATGRANGQQLVQMLQTLLAERFQLVVHRDTRPVPGYALVLSKGGLRILPDSAEGDPPRAIPDRGSLTFQRAPITWLPRMLTNILDTPVLDDTNLSGFYSFKLEWNPDEAAPIAPVAGQATEAAATLSVPPGIAPSALLAVLEQQIGLKLEPRKVPLEVVVIDHIERPSALD